MDKPSDIRRMVEIIKAAEEQKQQPKVVLSAFKGTTDQLLAQAHSAAKERAFDVDRIEARHHELLSDLPSRERDQVEPEVSRLFKELRNILTAVTYLGELSPTTLDSILAFGEKLTTHVSAGYLAEKGLKGVPLAGIEAGILTDSNFGNATILEESYGLVREKLRDVHVPLVAGFFGTDRAGRVAILGRGASDYVATFVGAAFGCKTVLFKDVDGVLTADPKIVPDAKLLSNLDYGTAIELARYGSKVLFEKAVVPAMKGKLPIEIRRFEKENQGTLISAEGGGSEATSCLKGMSMVRVTGLSTGAIGSILNSLDEVSAGDAVVMAATFRNEMSILAVEGQSDTVSEIARNIAGGNVKAEVRKGLSLVSLVGRRFRPAHVSEALQKAKVEPLAILTTPSGITSCAVVDAKDTEASVRTLHETLIGI